MSDTITPTPPVQEYVLGFMFNRATDMVVLIRKRPSHQHGGRLNGIGGKVEQSDHDEFKRTGASYAKIAMAREFEEEAGLHTYYHAWAKFGTIAGDGFIVHVFYAEMSHATLMGAKTMTDEDVAIIRMDQVVAGLHHVVPSIIPFIAMMREPETLRAGNLHFKPHA